MTEELIRLKRGFLRWMEAVLGVPSGLKHYSMRGEYNIVDLSTGKKTEFCETMEDFQYGLPCEAGWTYWEDGTTTFSWNCWYCGKRVIGEEEYARQVGVNLGSLGHQEDAPSTPLRVGVVEESK